MNITSHFFRLLHLLTLAVLLVGTTSAALAMPYNDNSDGTVTDTATGLIWMRCSMGQSWGNGTCTGSAATYTKDDAWGLSHIFAGHNDWRLATNEELLGITDTSRSSPAIDVIAFPNTPSYRFWTSTPYLPTLVHAYAVYFADGSLQADLFATQQYHARMVRNATVSSWTLNDTGITYCGDNTTNTANCATVSADGGTHPRQDARYGRDAAATSGNLTKIGGGEAGFDFTALNASGQPTTPSSGAMPHPCVRDNVTGLVWEVKTADSGLRDQNWTYTWYDSVHNYGGSPGTASGGACQTAGHCDTEKYVADVKATALCGFTDWRMPTARELEGIADMGRTSPAIEPTYFPNTPSSSFWSASPYAGNSISAWTVNFYRGNAYADGPYGHPGYRNYGLYVRLVRGGQ